MAARVVSMGLVDYSGETTSVQWYAAELDATGNFVAVAADANAIRVKIDALTLCNEKNVTMPAVFHTASGAAPTNVLAQRELAIRIFYVDTVNGRKGHLTVGGPDLSVLTLAGDNVSLTAGTVMPDIVTALEGHAVSRDGNTITVTGARLVGRNN